MTAKELAEKAFALLKQGVPFESIPLSARENYVAHAEAFQRTGTVTTYFDEACLAVVNTPQTLDACAQNEPLKISSAPEPELEPEVAPVPEIAATPKPTDEILPTEPDALPEPVQPTTKPAGMLAKLRRGKKQ